MSATFVPYDQRFARKVRAISVADPTDVIEYPSVSSAAKAIEGQVPQRNVRALLMRTITKKEVLLDRNWEVEGGAAIEPQQIQNDKKIVATNLGLNTRSNTEIPSIGRIIKNETSSISDETSLRKQQLLLKEKQMELLIRYIDILKDKNDPSIHMLVKQYLM
jgi:hypothetical protein